MRAQTREHSHYLPLLIRKFTNYIVRKIRIFMENNRQKLTANIIHMAFLPFHREMFAIFFRYLSWFFDPSRFSFSHPIFFELSRETIGYVLIKFNYVVWETTFVVGKCTFERKMHVDLQNG